MATQAMQGEREAKRARQACENCRRKKTRCTGERPICQFCAKLGQTCTYARRITTTTTNTTLVPSSNRSENLQNQSGSCTQSVGPYSVGPDRALSSSQPSDLATRLALIEARLGLGTRDLLTASDTSATESPSRTVTHATLPQSPQGGDGDSSYRSRSGRSVATVERNSKTSKFSTVPPSSILESLTDVYFSHCHNQPYCYFREAEFRSNLADGSVPEYLLMAFAATAARYSTNAYFENCQKEAIEIYSKTAWQIVLQKVFSSEQGLDLKAVQATNLLAIVDFTAGQHRMGWVKIGLAVRFAQGLRLNVEPDAAISLGQQEEQRRVFWSVYILDRFLSCCRLRPPSLVDADCTVALPISERQLRTGISPQQPTLAVLKDLPDMTVIRSLDHSSLIVLMASTLGRVVRCSQQQSTSKSFPPWDFRSDFAKISTILLSFETLLSVGNADLTAYFRSNFETHAGFDRQAAGQSIWSRGVYHLCYCLLCHPFFLYRYQQHHPDTFPHSFIRASLRQCKEHVEQLTALLQVVDETNCCARGSFLGYFAVVAGVVHKLYEYSTDLGEQEQAHKSLETCLNFLERGFALWGNYSRMSSALTEFQINQVQALALVETPYFQPDRVTKLDLDHLSRMLDYGWLSDANRIDRTALPDTPHTPQPVDFGPWAMFEELIGGDVEQPLDLVGHGMNAFMQGSSPDRQWWLNEDGEGKGPTRPVQTLEF